MSETVLKVLQVLEKHSDEKHKLTQKDIIRYLENDGYYDEEEKNEKRGSIKRALDALRNAGYAIIGTRGVYLEHLFSDAELHLMIDGIMTSRFIPEDDSRTLVKKIENLSSRNFTTHVNLSSLDKMSKSENTELLSIMNTLEEAINKYKQIRFQYCHYDINKKLIPGKEHTVSPKQMIVNNQRYYLIVYDNDYDNNAAYRIDRIANIEILETPSRGDPISYSEFSAGLPYLFTDKKEQVRFLIEERCLDDVIDWFGKDFTVRKKEDGRLEIFLKVSLLAMKYWAIQYSDSVEIISPPKLRNDVISALQKAFEKYTKSNCLY